MKDKTRSKLNLTIKSMGWKHMSWGNSEIAQMRGRLDFLLHTLSVLFISQNYSLGVNEMDLGVQHTGISRTSIRKSDREVALTLLQQCEWGRRAGQHVIFLMEKVVTRNQPLIKEF